MDKGRKSPEQLILEIVATIANFEAPMVAKFIVFHAVALFGALFAVHSTLKEITDAIAKRLIP